MTDHTSFSASLSKATRALLGGIMLVTSLLLFTNVIMRYVFNSPIFWAEELARYLMVWLIFLGAGELSAREGHISVNLITRLLGPQGNLVLQRTVGLICLLFCAVLTYYSWRHTMRIRSAHQTTAALDLPMWWAYLAIPVGSALMTVRYALDLVGRQTNET